MVTESRTLRCIGDPFGVGHDCLAPATGFVFGQLPDESFAPVIVAVPCCHEHEQLCVDFVGTHNPMHEAFLYDIAAFDEVRTIVESELSGDLFVYQRSAA